MTTPGVEPALAEMMDAVFADYRRSHVPSTTRDPELWSRLDTLGLVRLTGAEQYGGSGAGWPEAAELLSAAVRHGVRVPLAEHDLLACWLLEAADIHVDDAARTLGLLDEHGRASGVPWASTADRIALVWQRDGESLVADADLADIEICSGANIVGEPRDTIATDPKCLAGVPVGADLVTQLRLKAALVRSIQVCAALDNALELSIQHATSREQFGRPLSRFQAVAHLMSDIAAEAALARSATEAALSTAIDSDWSAPHLEFLVAAARSCAGHATSVVVRNAHQVHGAIGTTSEHRLHEFTRAALAWRSEFGSVQYWDARVTDMALQAGAGQLWGLIST
ncbi:MAG: acyl-CoA dehydrogenase [Actinomycetia bacterium]|nr:acyl-CoA dehydrogenase [Actinomycetes bacterium]MCH9700134.1 acyl-CoA dehydrogenase [Actinomycetes bacterium]MCH9762430.1 acyl-CoA dehydrogenase [Actinomycetes bacterium]